MRNICGLTMLGCMLFTSLSRASVITEEITLDMLPQASTDHIEQVLTGAELLQAWKEVENGKECYSVRIMYKGRILEYYVSP